MKRKLLCGTLAALMTLSSTVAFAQNEPVTTAQTEETAGVLRISEAPAALPFTDVQTNQWFYQYVSVCYTDKLVSGMSATEFAPTSILNEAQCATFCARLLAAQRGETLDESYDTSKGESWFTPILRYLEEFDLQVVPEVQCTRARFLSMLGKVIDDETLTAVYTVNVLPDSEDETVLKFYRAGILNGIDSYGTFNPNGILKRVEAAAMLARILRPELRVAVNLEDYSPFRAAGVSPDTVFFSTAAGSVTAQLYLGTVNELIGELETACAEQDMEFNWYNTVGEQTFLTYVTEEALTRLNVSKSQGTEVYGVFNLQVYYSELIREWKKYCPLCQDNTEEVAAQTVTTLPAEGNTPVVTDQPIG